MNSLQVVFGNIEKIYTHHRNEFLAWESPLRPAKSMPRDIFAAINRYKEFYIANNKPRSISSQIIMEIFELNEQKDVFVQNRRILREFDFAFQEGEEFIFKDNFIDFCNGNISSEDYYLHKLKGVKSVTDFTMHYNATICVLREGYIYGEITYFPDSNPDFIQHLPDVEERAKFCMRVHEIYGFIGKKGKGIIEQGDYTPNINYRFISPLLKLGLIERSEKNNPFTTYKLTENGLLILKEIDRSLSGINDISDARYPSKVIPFPFNRIVFGAPGTGKSYRLEQERVVFGENYERVTFHPNYSYAQFVGTYKPIPSKDNEGKDAITYEYVPGPFMRVLVEAKKNTENQHLLIIEEINRANVAAVFGDIFQLLDRKNGSSEYQIETSEDIRKYLSKELDGENTDYKKIEIPSNMFIWATMNSADQGVFPMDTAFKRRWDFEYIGIDDEKQDMKDVIVELAQDSHDVRWNDLREKINLILSCECKINEDKLLGPYFISKSVIEADDLHKIKNNDKFLKAFESKVLMYLYDDVAKQKRTTIFAGCSDVSTYSKVCAEFRIKGEAIFENGLNLGFKTEPDGE